MSFLFIFDKDNVVEYTTESKPDRLKDLQTFTESALNKEEDVTENTFTTTSTEKSNQSGSKVVFEKNTFCQLNCISDN